MYSWLINNLPLNILVLVLERVNVSPHLVKGETRQGPRGGGGPGAPGGGGDQPCPGLGVRTSDPRAVRESMCVVSSPQLVVICHIGPEGLPLRMMSRFGMWVSDVGRVAM